MELNRIVIDNFRNIQHAEYDHLAKINIFSGPNRMGKTNTILAIYWAMTDVMMDGSSDFPSIKPQSDPSAEVSVELTFDSFKLRKVYKEKWVKTRGSNDMTLTGHETIYYLDDVKTAITEAKKTLAKNFGVEGKTEIGKFDLLRAVMDPYYIARNDWKVTRKFIIELVGDVTNDEIIATKPEFMAIEDRLKTSGWDTDKAKKYYAGQIKDAKTQVESLTGQISGLTLIADTSEEDLSRAERQVAEINDAISAIRSGNHDDPMLAIAKREYENARDKAMQKETEERSELRKQLDAQDAIREDFRKKIEAKEQELKTAKNDLILFDNKMNADQLELNRTKLAISSKQSEKDSLLATYHRLKDAAGKADEEAVKCPNCGFVLNQDSIENQKKKLQQNIDETIAKGKSLALEIQNLQLMADELDKKLAAAEADRKPLDAAFKDLQNQVADLEKDRSETVKELKFIASPELQQLQMDVAAKRDALQAREAASRNDTTQAAKIQDLEVQKAVPNKVIGQHAAYEQAQETIHGLQIQKDAAQKAQVKGEQCLALCDEFIRAKLEAFNKRIETVFGTRIHFTLIQENIKEGSWSEVCFPSVLDKETAFLNGSGSEQILAGIYMAECIKNKLQIADIPYIFDEADKLDAASLSSIATNAQIITTKVDDINHKTVELVTR
ncbi:MAG: AAA family ATPase [Galactobacillus timonensis]|uniref:AAA family ATPase n=1 Tax=Galactobacillus timonensis TaxID=2041840 RepID=UPI0023F3A725|nr:AAA family ATPase [Galactobacillus timonensis]MCI6068206.1 AAA family ATPase [Galactobacillus timonensis]